MKHQKVIVGYIEYKDEDNQLINRQQITPLNIISDEDTIVEYILEELGIEIYVLEPITEEPVFYNYQLN